MRLIVFLIGATLYGSVIADVRYKLATGDLMSADAIADEFCRNHAGTSECAAALSWLARGAEMTKNYALAKGYVERTEALNHQLLKANRVEDDAFLATSVGAIYEVRARLLAEQGARDQAVQLLRSELPKWKDWAVQVRLQKNLNMLTLQGTPAPLTFPQMKGKPGMLFLWGHWCSDCVGQEPALARIWRRYRTQGLVLIAPTRRNGTAQDRDGVSPAEEDAEIESVWKASYADLSDVPHPINEAALRAYGVTSTPTLVLIDRDGRVRMYEPYRMSEAALATRIDALLR